MNCAGAGPGQLAVHGWGWGFAGHRTCGVLRCRDRGSAASGSEGALCQRGHCAGRRSFRPGRYGCHGAECVVSNVVAGLNGQHRPGRVGAGPGRSRGPEAGGARTRLVSPQRSTRQSHRCVVYWLSITANGAGVLWQIARAGLRSAGARSTPGPSPQKLLHSQISTWPAGLASHSLSRKHVFSEHVTHWMGGPGLSINVGLGVLMEKGYGEPSTQLERGL